MSTSESKSVLLPEGLRNVQEHVINALKDAIGLANGEPVNAVHVLLSCISSREQTEAFRKIRELSNQKPQKLRPANSLHGEWNEALGKSMDVFFSLEFDSELGFWGRDLITVALLSNDDSLNSFFQRDLPGIRTDWFEFVSSGSHRNKQDWLKWWKAAGLERKDQKNTNVNLQVDDATEVDELGRQPFADALQEYVTRLWQSDQRAAYTLLIDGEWGSGKSTVMNLLKKGLTSSQQKWITGEFNAWQNQHMSMPWWIFLDTVFKSIVSQSSLFRCLCLKVQECVWRLDVMNRAKLISLLILLAVAMISPGLDFSGISLLGKVFSDETLKDHVGILVSIISLIGSVWLFISSVVNSLLPASENAARQFKENVRDPMQKMKVHYARLIKKTKRPVCVFIDDIDRCDPKFVVSFLEGIQTLFKSEKVLYVIAGDARWIRACFEIQYKDLKEPISRPGHSLGNSFLEKTLQQTVTLPPLPRDTLRVYWKSRLTGERKGIDKSKYADAIQSLTSMNNEQILDVISKTEGEKKVVLREAAAKAAYSERVLKEIDHDLVRFEDLIPPNPRAIKRLVNNIALEMAANYLSEKARPLDEVIRITILNNRYPLLIQKLKSGEQVNLGDYPEVGAILEQVISPVSVEKIRQILA
ncbi:MAG: P-loop NTPase fold protein [Cyclobacteriaceae bacterium]|jgi:hypothetical protein